jgi:hypothetical protein
VRCGCRAGDVLIELKKEIGVSRTGFWRLQSFLLSFWIMMDTPDLRPSLMMVTKHEIRSFNAWMKTRSR